MLTLQNRAANAPAAPAGMSPASQPAPTSAGQSSDQDDWTVGRVASQIWDGLTDPRLADGVKVAGKYGLIGAGIGAASIGASAAAGFGGAGLLPSMASGAGSALTGTAARIAAAGAPAVARAKRAGEAVERAAQQIETTLKHPGIIQGIGEFGAGTADPNPPSATSLPMSLGAGAKKLLDETLFSEE